MSSTVIAVVSDVHAGSTVALCPPKVRLDDGGEYVASTVQCWLWQHWNGFWTESVDQELTRAKADRFYTVFNGDMVEGDHHGTTQILSGNPNPQAYVVNSAMAVVLKMKPDRLFFIRGTAAHVGKSASAEERIADGLWRDQRPVERDLDRGSASWWELNMTVDGKRLNFKHHGRMGSRPHTRGNIVDLLAYQIWSEHALRGLPHPHLAVRSHFHTFDHSTRYPTQVLATPAWQLHTEHSWKVVPENLADIGGCIITITDGDMTVKPIIYQPDYRGTEWTESQSASKTSLKRSQALVPADRTKGPRSENSATSPAGRASKSAARSTRSPKKGGSRRSR